MKWEKKICIRITVRRLVVAILTASIVANLIIVGVVFGSESSTPPDTLPPLMNTATVGQESTPFVAVSVTNEIFTFTPVPSSTVTMTSTGTPTELPTLNVCFLRSDWPVYQVQEGDTLPRVARITGSTVEDLMLANCLLTETISAGQRLYVPWLPVNTSTVIPTLTLTFTPSATATNTVTDTFTPTVTDTPPYEPDYTPTYMPVTPVTVSPTGGPIYLQQSR